MIGVLNIFKSKEQKEIDELEGQRKKITLQIARIKKLPHVWIPEYLDREKSDIRFDMDGADYILRVPHNSYNVGSVLQDILANTGYCVSWADVRHYGICLKLESQEKMIRRSGLPDGF